jgi:hypothetical protein
MIKIELINGQFWQASILNKVVYCSRSLSLLLEELTRMAKGNELIIYEILNNQ